MKLLHKSIKVLSEFTSTDDGRPALKGVFVKGNRAVATNGKMLVETKLAEYNDQFPDVDTMLADNDKPVIIPKAVFDKAQANVPRKPRLPILENVLMISDGEDVELIATDLDNSVSVKGKSIEGDYPDIDHVKPAGDPEFTIAVDADLLAKLSKLAKNPGNISKVKLQFYGAEQAIAFETYGKTKFTGLIAPIRLDA